MLIKLKETANTSNVLDITDLVKYGGYDWSLNSVDSEDSGRNLDSNMMLTRLAWKAKHKLSFVPLTGSQKHSIEEFLKKTFLTVEITENYGRADQFIETYNAYVGGTISSAHLVSHDDGTDLYENFSISLIER